MKLDVIKFVRRRRDEIGWAGLERVAVLYFLDGSQIDKDLAEKHVRECELRLVTIEVGGDRPSRSD